MSSSTRKYTKISGLRYREHATRKHGLQKDRYFIIRYMVDGKRKEEGLGWSSEGWTEKKAAARLFELKENNRIGLGPKTLAEKRKIATEELSKKAEESRQKEATKLFHVFDKYIANARVDRVEKTCKIDEYTYKKWIKPYMQDKTLDEITPALLEEIKKTMFDAGKAHKTIKHVLALIRQIFNFAIRLDLYNGYNPVQKVKLPKIDNKRERFLSQEEAAILFDELKHISENTGKPSNVHDIALISLHCGLRAGEVFNIKWHDINFKNETISIMDPKTKKNRTAYMTPHVKEMLLKIKGTGIISNNGYIFLSKTGKKMKSISKSYRDAVKKLGFNEGIIDKRRRVVFHTLRHTYASWLAMSEVDLYAVQRLMGHSTISMTERYAHLSPNYLKDAVKKFINNFGESVEKIA